MRRRAAMARSGSMTDGSTVRWMGAADMEVAMGDGLLDRPTHTLDWPLAALRTWLPAMLAVVRGAMATREAARWAWMVALALKLGLVAQCVEGRRHVTNVASA